LFINPLQPMNGSPIIYSLAKVSQTIILLRKLPGLPTISLRGSARSLHPHPPF